MAFDFNQFAQSGGSKVITNPNEQRQVTRDTLNSGGSKIVQPTPNTNNNRNRSRNNQPSGNEKVTVADYPAQKVPPIRSTDYVPEVKKDPNKYYANLPKYGGVYTYEGEGQQGKFIPTTNPNYVPEGNYKQGTYEIRDNQIYWKTNDTLTTQPLTTQGWDVWGSTGKTNVTYNTPAGLSTYEVGSNEKMAFTPSTGEFKVYNQGTTIPKDSYQINPMSGEKLYGGMTASDFYSQAKQRADQGNILQKGIFYASLGTVQGNIFGLGAVGELIGGGNVTKYVGEKFAESWYPNSGEKLASPLSWTARSPVTQSAVLVGIGSLALGVVTTFGATVLSKVPFVSNLVLKGATYSAPLVYSASQTASYVAPAAIYSYGTKGEKIISKGGSGGDVANYYTTSALNFGVGLAGYSIGAGFAKNYVIKSAIKELENKPFTILPQSMGETVQYNNAFGLYKNYNIIASRTSGINSQLIVMDLKAIPTSDGSTALGLSSGKTIFNIRSGFFGKNTIEMPFQIGGKTSILVQDNIGRTIFSDGLKITTDVGLGAGGSTRGIIYYGDKSKGFYGIGVSQKQGEMINLVGGNNKFKLGFRFKDLILKGGSYKESGLMTGETGMEVTLQPSLRSGIGIKGQIPAYNPTRSIDRGEIIDIVSPIDAKPKGFYAGESGTGSIQQQITKQLPQLDVGSTSGGIVQGLKGTTEVAQQPFQYSTGQFAGLGLYERTGESTMSSKLFGGQSQQGFLQPQQMQVQNSKQEFINVNTIQAFQSPLTLQTQQFGKANQLFAQPKTLQLGSYAIADQIMVDQIVRQNQMFGKVTQTFGQPDQTYDRTQLQQVTSFANPIFDIGTPTPNPIFGFGLPSVSFDTTLGSVSSKGKQKKRRLPSIYAAEMGITAPRASSLEITGIVSRPILTSRRKKR